MARLAAIAVVLALLAVCAHAQRTNEEIKTPPPGAQTFLIPSGWGLKSWKYAPDCGYDANGLYTCTSTVWTLWGYFPPRPLPGPQQICTPSPALQSTVAVSCNLASTLRRAFAGGCTCNPNAAGISEVVAVNNAVNLNAGVPAPCGGTTGLACNGWECTCVDPLTGLAGVTGSRVCVTCW